MVLKRMLLIAVIMIIINAIMISPIYAMGDIISSGKNFLEKGQKVEEVINTTALQSTSNFIYNMFLTVAIVLAVGVGTVLGIKFITSSVEGQAKIKEAIVPYIVGCIIIFAAFPIWSFIVGSGQDATGIDPDKEGSGEVPTVIDNWNSSISAKEYIDSGGNLQEISNSKLVEWYGQLARLADRGRYEEYYEKVKTEVDNRGGYEAIK